MVRRDVAARKVARASAWLADVEVLLTPSPEAFLADVKNRDLATFYIFLAIQECIDLAAHWVADAGWTPPDDVAGVFDVLAERHVIDRHLADELRAAAGLRNRIAHGYAAVDHRRLHAEAREGLQALRQFLAVVAAAASS
jgi:uncharacterized protein YutE (UPF0331/DUF86 family)